jgi:hypothetical protein
MRIGQIRIFCLRLADNFVANREDNSACTVAHVEFSVDAPQVRFNRMVTNKQFFSNRLVTHALHEQLQYFYFPRRQCHQRRGCLVVGASLVAHGGYYSPNSIALKIITSALAEP